MLRPGGVPPDQPADDLARQAAAVLSERAAGAPHDVAVVLGSGWLPAADALGPAVVELPFTELPGFAPPAVAGHAGRVRSLMVGHSRALVFLGRTHLYEGHGVDSVVHGVRTAAATGVRTIVLTNACGGLAGYSVGRPVLIADHLNLTGASPLVGPRFVDMTDAYSPRLRALARDLDPSLAEGVYAQFRGPQYETPAEVRMAAALGANLVGMSTAVETIAARAEGCEVLGLSLVTNPAAGVAGGRLDHADVVAAGAAAAGEMGRLLRALIETL